MITIKATEKGLLKLVSGIEGFINAVNHRKEPLDKIKQEQADRWADNFQSEGGEYVAWADLAESTIETRNRLGFGPGPILQRTGATLDHFISQNQQGRVTNAAVNWNFSNRVPASTVSHHTGYTLRGSTIPARILWDLDSEDEDRGEEILEDWLEEKANQHLG